MTPERARPARSTPSRRKPVILLADDQETSIVVAQTILTEQGFEFVVARDGVEALDKARSARPDLILLDIGMPRLDGIGTARALRADPATASIPIIMVTTRGDEASFEQAYARGCADYILKPIRSEELIAKVYSVIPS